MRRKKQGEKEKITDLFRTAFSTAQHSFVLQPLVHINGRGWLELENCSKILEYGPQRIIFHMLELCITVYGEEMVIVSLDAHITEIRGRIFRMDFGEADP